MLFSSLSAIGKVSKPKCIQPAQTGAVETGKYKTNNVRLFASYDDLVSDPAIQVIVIVYPMRFITHFL